MSGLPQLGQKISVDKVGKIIDGVIDEEKFRLDLEGMKKPEMQRREEAQEVLDRVRNTILREIREEAG